MAGTIHTVFDSVGLESMKQTETLLAQHAQFLQAKQQHEIINEKLLLTNNT